MARRILIAEDDEGLSELIRSIVEEIDCEAICVANYRQVLSILQNQAIDLMLLDYSMPDMTALDGIQLMQEQGLQPPPFIIATGQGDEKTAVQMMKSGARDYLVKDSVFLDLLPEIIKRTLRDLDNEQERKKGADYLSAVLDAVHDAVFVHEGKSGCILDVNRRMSELYGYTREEALGMNIGILSQDQPPYTQEDALHWLDQARQGSQPIFEWMTRHKDGTLFPVEVSVRHAWIGGSEHFVVTVRDIRERKQAEAEHARLQSQFAQAQKMDAIGQLAGGVAHDFNNMLAGILGGADLLRSRMGPQSDPLVTKYISLIIESASRAADLTKKLLSFARRSPVEKTPINVHHALQVAIDLLRGSVDKRITIDVRMSAENLWVLGDEAALQSAFLNLGINAAHAMSEGGCISFESRSCQITDENDLCKERNLAPGTYVEVRVRDTGCGIPESEKNKIFEPFFTTKPQGRGTGLGLPAALGAIEQHRGSICVESQLGKGSTFSVFLPLTEQRQIRFPDCQEVQPKSQGHILLIDDEVVMRDCASAILEEAGYKVLCASDGVEGLACYQKYAGEIDLVILDMIMPQMNGRDCFHALRALRPDVRVILCSGLSDEQDVSDLRGNGLTGSISKPFRGNDLLRVVKAAISSEQPSGRA